MNVQNVELIWEHTLFQEQQLYSYSFLVSFLHPAPPLTLLACRSIYMDRQIRRDASVSDKGYGSPPRRTGRRRCDTTSAIHEPRAALDWPHTSATFFLITPHPLD